MANSFAGTSIACLKGANPSTELLAIKSGAELLATRTAELRQRSIDLGIDLRSQRQRDLDDALFEARYGDK